MIERERKGQKIKGKSKKDQLRGNADPRLSPKQFQKKNSTNQALDRLDSGRPLSIGCWNQLQQAICHDLKQPSTPGLWSTDHSVYDLPHLLVQGRHQNFAQPSKPIRNKYMFRRWGRRFVQFRTTRPFDWAFFAFQVFYSEFLFLIAVSCG